ncbi:MAG: hypothetical protein K0Q59_1022 [Paenibacillus sp.]|nr:hypothetical protein [Paenibacillus sp.]
MENGFALVLNRLKRLRRQRLLSDESGSMTLEAVVALPFFLAFVLALICVIKLTVADIALHNAVSATVKQVAANGYPIEVMANEAKDAFVNSDFGQTILEWVGHVQAVRDKIEQGEQWVDDYRAFIPDWLFETIDLERRKREQAEQQVADSLNSLVNAAFKQAVLHYADTHVLNRDSLTIVEVELPSFTSRDQPFIGITAEYTVRLPIPFLDKRVTLRKRGYERLWFGV